MHTNFNDPTNQSSSLSQSEDHQEQPTAKPTIDEVLHSAEGKALINNVYNGVKKLSIGASTTVHTDLTEHLKSLSCEWGSHQEASS
jgi:hypothetical protein